MHRRSYVKEKAEQLSIAVALGEGRVVKNDIEEDVTGRTCMQYRET